MNLNSNKIATQTITSWAAARYVILHKFAFINIVVLWLENGCNQPQHLSTELKLKVHRKQHRKYCIIIKQFGLPARVCYALAVRLNVFYAGTKCSNFKVFSVNSQNLDFKTKHLSKKVRKINEIAVSFAGNRFCYAWAVFLAIGSYFTNT